MAYPLEGQVCAHRKRTLLEMKGPIQLSMVRPPAGQRLVDPAATAPEPSKNTWSVPAGQVRPQMTYPLPSTFGPGVTLSPVSHAAPERARRCLTLRETVEPRLPCAVSFYTTAPSTRQPSPATSRIDPAPATADPRKVLQASTTLRPRHPAVVAPPERSWDLEFRNSPPALPPAHHPIPIKSYSAKHQYQPYASKDSIRIFVPAPHSPPMFRTLGSRVGLLYTLPFHQANARGASPRQRNRGRSKLQGARRRCRMMEGIEKDDMRSG
ncbi:hypothetical protein PMIN01_09585 [Paraphaeosphaeria minitans]|uniref:Uncharacterized protein n=1 Tax=Paraphaeosphaeria minitans TaxID=565426 RepID=A0A9P6KN73_9PLEO|nr:hypothetical protein PMIN01_09585 [Paraphaeosphaeria minitans]